MEEVVSRHHINRKISNYPILRINAGPKLREALAEGNNNPPTSQEEFVAE